MRKLIGLLPHTGYQLTLHTDQGWQYQHRAWRVLLKHGRIRQSMSHRATCLDNAACETVFSKLKAENRPDTDYANQEDLIQAIEEWIDYYNHRLDVFKYLETLFSAFTKRETPEIEAYLP